MYDRLFTITTKKHTTISRATYSRFDEANGWREGLRRCFAVAEEAEMAVGIMETPVNKSIREAHHWPRRTIRSPAIGKQGRRLQQCKEICVMLARQQCTFTIPGVGIILSRG